MVGGCVVPAVHTRWEVAVKHSRYELRGDGRHHDELESLERLGSDDAGGLESHERLVPLGMRSLPRVLTRAAAVDDRTRSCPGEKLACRRGRRARGRA